MGDQPLDATHVGDRLTVVVSDGQAPGPGGGAISRAAAETRTPHTGLPTRRRFLQLTAGAVTLASTLTGETGGLHALRGSGAFLLHPLRPDGRLLLRLHGRLQFHTVLLPGTADGHQHQLLLHLYHRTWCLHPTAVPRRELLPAIPSAVLLRHLRLIRPYAKKGGPSTWRVQSLVCAPRLPSTTKARPLER